VNPTLRARCKRLEASGKGKKVGSAGVRTSTRQQRPDTARRGDGPVEVLPTDPNAHPPGRRTDLLLTALLTQDHLRQGLSRSPKPVVLDPAVELEEDPELGPGEVDHSDQVSDRVADLVLRLGLGEMFAPEQVRRTSLARPGVPGVEELPKHVPMLPGANEQRMDLAHAQSQAMNADVIRMRVEATLEERYTVLDRAYHEDPAAVSDILGDPRMPEPIKKALRDGGVRGRIHRQLLERADTVESELTSGEEGRERLLQDPDLPGGVKQQLADIPVRALREPELIAGVGKLFRDAILAKEDALVASTVQQSLLMVHAAMNNYGKQLVERIQRGMKVAFSTAIVHMLERALWIVGLAVTLVLFIPEVPLRARATPAAVAAD